MDAELSAASPQSGTLSRLCAVGGGALLVLRRIVDAVLILLLAAMVGLIMFQILGRYVLNYSISWSEEAATFAQVWLVMLGAGLAMRNRHHVGIDVLINLCPAIVQQVAKSASFLLGAWFVTVVITGSMGLMTIGMIVSSPALGWPMALAYGSLPAGMSYFLLEFALSTFPEIRDPKSAQQPPVVE